MLRVTLWIGSCVLFFRDVGSNLWDEHLDGVQGALADGRIDSEDVGYKLLIGKRLERARNGVTNRMDVRCI